MIWPHLSHLKNSAQIAAAYTNAKKNNQRNVVTWIENHVDPDSLIDSFCRFSDPDSSTCFGYPLLMSYGRHCLDPEPLMPSTFPWQLGTEIDCPAFVTMPITSPTEEHELIPRDRDCSECLAEIGGYESEPDIRYSLAVEGKRSLGQSL